MSVFVNPSANNPLAVLYVFKDGGSYFYVWRKHVRGSGEGYVAIFNQLFKEEGALVALVNDYVVDLLVFHTVCYEKLRFIVNGTREQKTGIICGEVNMERYFLGNNTGHGFYGLYEQDLKNKRRVVLLKGGPGTGKSSILKKIASDAKKRGEDWEEWYCSGDPSSLDGVHLKERNVAIVDATSPHATGADLPVIKDVIVDLAGSLSRDKLRENEMDIINGINRKKRCFLSAYQHLKCALCHYNNQLALEKDGICFEDVRSFAVYLAKELKGSAKQNEVCRLRRKVFVSAICPIGESNFYDGLRDKKVVKISGDEYSMATLFSQLSSVLSGGVVYLNPLEPKHIDGFVYGDCAVVKDVGHLRDNIVESYDLSVYAHGLDKTKVEEEKNATYVEIARGIEWLNLARREHINIEKYFIDAMNFENNERLYEDIKREIFM